MRHLPDNTEIRFVFVKLDGLLDKRSLDEYIYRYQNLRKAEKIKKKREDDQLNRIYKRNTNRQRYDNRNSLQDDEFVMSPEYQRAKVRLDELETEETYEKNKNNPDLYPSLRTEHSGEARGKTYLGSTNKTVANNAVQKIFEMEEKIMQEKLRQIYANKPAKESHEPDEEELERDFHANSIVIIKKSKKKKGKK